MDRLPRPPESFIDGTPPHVRAYVEQLHSLIDYLYGVVEKHEARIAELESRITKTPNNSSLPPSGDHPHAKAASLRMADQGTLSMLSGQPGPMLRVA